LVTVLRPCCFVVQVIDVIVPVPLIVVPGGRFEQVSDFNAMVTGDVSTFRFVLANAPPGSSSAVITTATVASRFTVNTPSGGKARGNPEDGAEEDRQPHRDRLTEEDRRMLTGCHPQATVTVAGSASQVIRLANRVAEMTTLSCCNCQDAVAAPTRVRCPRRTTRKSAPRLAGSGGDAWA
jgi:hypothetical protein